MYSSHPRRPIRPKTLAAGLFALMMLVGCAPDCDRDLNHHTHVAQGHPVASERERSIEALRRALKVCEIPRDGIVLPGAEPPAHAAHIFLLLGELDAAIDALQSDRYSLSDDQQFVLLGYAVQHENDDYLEALLNVGLDPNAELGNTGVTVMFDATHAGIEAPARTCSAAAPAKRLWEALLW